MSLWDFDEKMESSLLICQIQNVGVDITGGCLHLHEPILHRRCCAGAVAVVDQSHDTVNQRIVALI